MTDITLSQEQNNAIEAILEWYKKGGTVFTLTGYAGTGKTTVLSTLLERLSDKVAVALCAPTGKATSVLRSKMGPYCRAKSIATLHRTIYYPPEEIEKNNLLFTSRKHIPADMLIIDEASMLNKEILWDVLKLNVPVVLIGDNFQLPPVSGEHIDELDNPDARLTHVFRQALDNPIIKAASPYGPEEELAAVAAQFREEPVDVIVTDCMGFTPRLGRLVAQESGKQVLVPRLILPKLIKALLVQQ